MLASPAATLDLRDAALTEALVLGVLRWQGELDAVVSAASGRRIEALDLEVLLALRLGIYQLRCLDRVPVHAAVSESVEIVKRARKASAAGFVNAVLRKAAAIPSAAPQPERCVPGWMLALARYGARAEALALAAWNVRTPICGSTCDSIPERRAPPGARVSRPRTEVAGCRRSLRAPVRHAVFSQVASVRDLGSRRVKRCWTCRPATAFDVCAAPGARRSGLKARGDGVGLAVAGDVSPTRLAVMRRLGTCRWRW
jgi:16S rRNA (cytosine967-C5)-methyltransferase